ncbi:hypothetical protein Pmar_PMAR005424 [Perkinsus marinus ATCC 50983]|uniref:Uncharacterized protein n=1 Tax=Perkinsus marinus (strain ATCC 50983 / TXsc) TaxID=423536 RepID=C5KBF5_PERM5|nr:hypothetical protein Pmar_PMAR005424 [Perkinsus marinus ATCC 50983]EER18481.1 hypothetical protein Pmar_PMAR005424 [Perkinsus marinus ATCC 50983]|eukprot:XP_002786685.1 hypothetical protein Pmar_PMAR005424 [Perkinsus marinus ATCC 50983]
MVDVDVLKEARKNYERERARLLSDRKEGVDKAGLNPSMEDDEAMDRDLDILWGTLFRAS